MWRTVTPANRFVVDVTAAGATAVALPVVPAAAGAITSGVPTGSVAGSVNKIPKEDEAAIRSVFPAANYIVLYHDQGNVPQPRGVDWSEAREYSVKSKMDELNWGRWHVVVLRGRIVNVEWVND